MKEQLVFDTTDATSIAQSDSIGAYLRSADGTLLTHTDVSGKKALDVRVAEGINVEVDLAAADDSVSAWTKDGSGNAIGSTAGYLHVIAQQETSPWVVSATDLDIRDLVYTQDSVTAYQGTSPWVVSATDLDIRDLAFATDKVDVSGSAVTISSGSITVSDSALANTAIAHAKVNLALADTAQALVASPLSDRKYLLLRNMDNKRIFVGSASVDAATGFPVSPGSMLEMRAGAAVAINYVGETGATPEARTLELS